MVKNGQKNAVFGGVKKVPVGVAETKSGQKTLRKFSPVRLYSP